jgi:heptaprenyl diphosphate synthase
MASTTDPTAVLAVDVRPALTRVESLLLEVVASDQQIVGEAAAHLIRTGGKRLRPILVLLAGHLGDPDDARLVPCAAAVELTHLATLYHDDVIDSSSVRHGAPTANATYGNSIAVLAGDFMFARASGIATDLGTYVSRRLADTVARLCEGVIVEAAAAGRPGTPEGYLDIIRRKTAALIETACHLGAWLGGAAEAEVAAATEYGDAIGMAFQLSDDVLDIVGDARFGKEPGTDLREGVLTLPALETLTGAARGGDELRAALDAGDVDSALAVLRSNGSIERARTQVAAWQERAQAALDRLPDGVARDGLARISAFIGDRTA